MTIRKFALMGGAVSAVIATAGSLSGARADDAIPTPMSLYDGFYFGVTGGYATGQSDVDGELRRNHRDPSTQAVSEDGKADLDGGMIGGLLGFDYNVGNGLVMGVLGDLSVAGIEGGTDVAPSVIGLSGSDYRVDTKVNWLGTLRGRVGFEFGKALIYGTGGLAFGGVEAELRAAGAGKVGSDSATQVGWTLGAGFNYMLSDRLILGGEYLYVDLGKESYGFGRSGKADTDVNMNVFRGTLGYKF